MDQKITCKFCGHWKNYDEASIKKFSEMPELYDCELCHHGHPEGHVGFIGHYHACSWCQQVSKSDFCGCQESLEASISTIKITYPDMKRPDRVNEAEESGKTMRSFNKIVRNNKLEKLKRDEHVEQLLVKTVDLLTQLVKQKEVKHPV